MVGIENANGNFLDGFKLTAHRWFPVAPATMQRVQDRIHSKYYNQDPQALVADVRSDASLYLFCVRKLRKVIRSTNSAEDIEALRGSIGTIIDELKLKQAHHSAETQPFQIERQREIVLSSTVVDLLGDKMQVDRDDGFTCALLRQLGYALVAYNYPTIYRQALDEVGAQGSAGRTDLNTVLHSNLGFSPALLGLRFAEVWGLPDEITGEIGQQSQHEPQRRSKGGLAQVCEIGEAFARANNPHLYPNPRDDWETAMNVLNHHLGPDCLTLIKKHAGAIYGEAVNQLLPTGTLGQAEENHGASYGETRFYNNLFIKPLPETVQDPIKSLYDRMDNSKVDPELIRELLQNIAERLGFGAAVVYTLDPAEATLNPVFRKGKPRFTTLRPISTAARLNETDPVKRAFLADQVICEEGSRTKDDRRLLLALPIRGRNRIGVLCLEQAEKPGPDHVEPLLGAKFILTTLKDLLAIG